MFFNRMLYPTLWLIIVFTSIPVMAEDRALIIGINAYGGEAALQGCVRDAQNMKQLIQEVWGYKPNQIKVLLDAAATRRGILTAFNEWLIRGTQPGDRVVFHYSGHGSELPTLTGGKKDPIDQTLCPVDTGANPNKNMIRDKEINALLRQLKGRQVIFIADSCHSGTITRNLGKPNTHTLKARLFRFSDSPPLKGPSSRAIVGLPEPTNNFVEPLSNVIAYSAVSASQVALDEGAAGGVFTQTFMKAVRDKAADRNGDGKITHAEVLNYLRNESQTYCDKTGGCDRNNGRLTPQLDADPKWLSMDIHERGDVGMPPVSPSPTATLNVAQILNGNNTAQLQTRMLPTASLRLGDRMQINVSSQQNGYLIVLDINSQGKLTVIFPNDYSKKQNRKGILQAGQTVIIPDSSYGFDFVAEEPIGKSLLLTLLVEEDEVFVRNLLQQLPVSQDGFIAQTNMGQVQTTLQQLYRKLHQTVISSDGVGRPIKWSMVEIEYNIH